VVSAEPRSVRALAQSLRVIEAVRARDNPQLALAGLVLTRVDLMRASCQQATGALWEGFDCVLESLIAESDAIAKAWALGVPVGHIGAEGEAVARRFAALARELEESLQSSKSEAEQEHVDGIRPFF
jgi:cellulose biosynthesis protein BcsQ